MSVTEDSFTPFTADCGYCLKWQYLLLTLFKSKVKSYSYYLIAIFNTMTCNNYTGKLYTFGCKYMYNLGDSLL